ncbi:hypothetical protein M413DRAFT_14526 [Hebeloma cylindrosporum]|uniref:Uncharacterized protein n=1 Tax=Hebeloma cylindrosporum TaxID=76867 RepID=A0A0C3BVU5_HEBCY|nr:hypothetical protein M413DRAFT_14526 [Hebeloma cylindrosporum h7]
MSDSQWYTTRTGEGVEIGAGCHWRRQIGPPKAWFRNFGVVQTRRNEGGAWICRQNCPDPIFHFASLGSVIPWLTRMSAVVIEFPVSEWWHRARRRDNSLALFDARVVRIVEEVSRTYACPGPYKSK